MRGNRIDVGGEVYHCMNRDVGKQQIFFYDRDYRLYTADLVDNVLKWKYSSLYRRYNGTDKQKKILTPWMIDEPDNYLQIVMQDLTPDESSQIEISEAHAVPYGDDAYIIEVAEKFNLKSILKGKWRLGGKGKKAIGAISFKGFLNYTT